MSTLLATPDRTLITVADLNARADHLLPQIAVGAVHRERDRELPFDAVAQIAKARLYTCRIPTKFGRKLWRRANAPSLRPSCSCSLQRWKPESPAMR